MRTCPYPSIWLLNPLRAARAGACVCAGRRRLRWRSQVRTCARIRCLTACACTMRAQRRAHAWRSFGLDTASLWTESASDAFSRWAVAPHTDQDCSFLGPCINSCGPSHGPRRTKTAASWVRTLTAAAPHTDQGCARALRGAGHAGAEYIAATDPLTLRHRARMIADDLGRFSTLLPARSLIDYPHS